MKVPQFFSTRLWTIDLIKQYHIKLNTMQQKFHNIIKLKIYPSITPVTKFQHKANVFIVCIN